MRWVLVSDKLPDHGQEILFYDLENNCLDMGHYDAISEKFASIALYHSPINEVLFWGAIPDYNKIVNDFV